MSLISLAAMLKNSCNGYRSLKRGYQDIVQLNYCEPPLRISKVALDRVKKRFNIFIHIKNQHFYPMHSADSLLANKEYFSQFLKTDQIHVEMLKDFECYGAKHKILKISLLKNKAKIALLSLDEGFQVYSQELIIENNNAGFVNLPLDEFLEDDRERLRLVIA